MTDSLLPTRRGAVAGLAVAALGAGKSGGVSGKTTEWPSAVAAIERRTGGRLGVALKADGREFSYRGNERFPMCSTFKILAASNVLERVDLGRETLERVIHYSAQELVTASPVTSLAIDRGLTIEAICAAAITRSDNTAGNLLLREGGGTAGLTGFARRIGDPVTRLDRLEPLLNEAAIGDVRDTTTPLAMLHNLQTLTLTNFLSQASRQMLSSWLIGNRTGDHRLRAGLPTHWLIGDKTGTGESGTFGHVAVIWPRHAPPALLTVYLTRATTAPSAVEALFASIAQLSAERIMRS